jgi:hypothetical protein
MITEMDLFNLHKHQRDEESRRRYTRSAPDSEHNRSLAHLVERDVAAHIWQMGYSARWMPHNSRFDLLVDGCLRIEVKAATWTPPGRYQAQLHNLADVIVFCCANGRYHYFVIPVNEVGARSHLAVWSYAPEDYAGQWRPYLENWALLGQHIETARRQNVYQYSFNLEV